MMTRRPAAQILTASLVLAALGLAACSDSTAVPPAAPASSVSTVPSPSASTTPSDSPSPSAPSSTAPSATAPASPAPSSAAERLTILEAIAVARDTVDGAVVDVDTDDDTGTLAWEVDVRRSSSQIAELRIDAATGRVISNRADNDVPDEARSSAPETSAAEAVRIAERRVDGDAVQVDLGDDGAPRTWQVTVRQSANRSVEVTLNADSGAYLSQEVDD